MKKSIKHLLLKTSLFALFLSLTFNASAQTWNVPTSINPPDQTSLE